MVPIFGGTLPPVKYSDLEKLQSDPQESLFGNITIDVKPGEVKKTYLELVDFYSKEFKEENKKPTIIGGEGSEFIVWYDFTPNGVPFSIMLQIPMEEDMEILDSGYTLKNIWKIFKLILGLNKDIEDLEVRESGHIYVSYSISPFSRSPFYKE